MSDITTIGQQYTLSFWMKTANAEAGLTVCDNALSVSTEWTRHVITFVATSENVTWTFGNAETYYMYHPQLEIGNKATDWTPAPEDQPEEMEARFTVEADKVQAQFTVVNESVNDLGEAIKEKYSKTITETENGISITDSNGVYEIQLDNVEGVTIRKNGEIRSQLVDDDFYTGNIVVEVNERAQLGGFAFVPRSDGSLSFLKVGE